MRISSVLLDKNCQVLTIVPDFTFPAHRCRQEPDLLPGKVALKAPDDFVVTEPFFQCAAQIQSVFHVTLRLDTAFAEII
jgi:hypothetical protein